MPRPRSECFIRPPFSSGSTCAHGLECDGDPRIQEETIEESLAALIAALIARTPAAGPSGWPQTPPMIASRLAPARTSGARLAAVMPPMAHEGTFDRCAHRRSTSGSARLAHRLDGAGKSAPNAT